MSIFEVQVGGSRGRGLRDERREVRHSFKTRANPENSICNCNRLLCHSLPGAHSTGFFFQSVKQHHLSWQAHCAHLWLMLALTKPLPRTNIKNNCTSIPFLSDKHMRKLSWHKHLHQFFFCLHGLCLYGYTYACLYCVSCKYYDRITGQPGVSVLEIWSMEGGQAGRDLCAWPGLAKCRPSHQEEKLPSVLENQICEKQIELPCDKELQQMARQMIEHEQRFCFCFCFSLCQLESRTKWHGTVTDLSVAASSEWVIYYAAILSNCG